MTHAPVRPSTDPVAAARLTGVRAALVWTAAGFAAVIGVAGAILLSEPGETQLFLVPVLAFLGATYGTVGALVATRQPRNPVGWLLLGAGIILGLSMFASTYAKVSIEQHGGDLPGTLLLAWLSSFTFVPLLGIVLVVVPLVFPTGRPLSPRWGWAVALAVVASVARLVHDAFAPGPLSTFDSIPNPVGIPALDAIAPLLALADPLMVLVAFPVALASMVVRFKRANAIERAQLKWFASAAAFATVFLALTLTDLSPFNDIGWLLWILGVAAMPISIAVALLRYRLYDIDRIISRTIAWSLVSAILVAGFALGIVALQAVLAGVTQGETVAVAASTLIAFAAAQPLLGRVQAAVDRRFNRAHYDAQRTVDAFGERLRDEVDLDRLRAATVGTVRDAVAPREAAVWLRDAGARS